MSIIFAAVADDDTGATDLAGMLAGHGLRCVLLIDHVSEQRLAEWAADCDAIVLGVGSRAVSPADAYARMRAGVRLLATLRPRTLQVKHCSTFDSTADGNIGQSIDAAMDETGETFTVALPALPVNGRTTYMGHHFVHQQLLSDSPMRNHPLTPMTNSNLVEHLQSQTARRVGLAPYPVVSAGANRLRDHLAQLRREGVQIALIDCLQDADLATIGEAIHDLPLISGSSAPALALPPVWLKSGWQPRPQAPLLDPGTRDGRGILIAAGSCSRATREQNEWSERSGIVSALVDPLDLARGISVEQSTRLAIQELAAGRTCLLRTLNGDGDVARVHRWVREANLSDTDAGCRIAFTFAALAKRIVDEVEPEGLIVAGGETSGAIARTLGFGALRVGANIEPGVPLCVAMGARQCPVVLKSGNFGNPDFYQRAIAAIRALSDPPIKDKQN